MIKHSSALVAAIVLLSLLGGSLRAEPAVVVPVKITGYIAFVKNRDGSEYLDMLLKITRGGVRLSGLEVRLNNKLASEVNYASYNYSCKISSTSAVVGNVVKLTVVKPSPVPGRIAAPFITAAGRVDSLLLLDAPRNGETISPHDRSIEVSWSGGMAPYTLKICEVLAGERCGNVDYGRDPVGMGIVLPMTLFTPGKEYSFNLFAPIGTMVLDGPLDPSSSIVFRRHVTNRVKISAIRRD